MRARQTGAWLRTRSKSVVVNATVPQSLRAIWTSRSMRIVANGVTSLMAAVRTLRRIVPDRAFDDPAGAQIGGAVSTTADRRIPGFATCNAYRVDALTGRELWNSGDEIATWNHYQPHGRQWRAYITTFDATIYAFGVTP